METKTWLKWDESGKHIPTVQFSSTIQAINTKKLEVTEVAASASWVVMQLLLPGQFPSTWSLIWYVFGFIYPRIKMQLKENPWSSSFFQPHASLHLISSSVCVWLASLYFCFVWVLGLILYGVRCLDLDFHVVVCLIVCTAPVMLAMVWCWTYVCFQYSPAWAWTVLVLVLYIWFYYIMSDCIVLFSFLYIFVNHRKPFDGIEPISPTNMDMHLIFRLKLFGPLCIS